MISLYMGGCKGKDDANGNSQKAAEKKTENKVDNDLVSSVVVIYLLAHTIVNLFIVYKMLDKNSNNILDKIKKDLRNVKKDIEGLSKPTYHTQVEHKTTADNSSSEKIISMINRIDLGPINERLNQILVLLKQHPTVQSASKQDVNCADSFNIILNTLTDNNDTIMQKIMDTMSEIKALKDKLDPFSDTRFMPLRINFPENVSLISLAYYSMNESKDNQALALRNFIRDFSKILGLHALSQNPEQLDQAYEALKVILENRTVELILPKQGAVYDDKTMNQNKVYGENSTVFSVVYPGFVLDDHMEKALVDVK